MAVIAHVGATSRIVRLEPLRAIGVVGIHPIPRRIGVGPAVVIGTRRQCAANDGTRGKAEADAQASTVTTMIPPAPANLLNRGIAITRQRFRGPGCASCADAGLAASTTVAPNATIRRLSGLICVTGILQECCRDAELTRCRPRRQRRKSRLTFPRAMRPLAAGRILRNAKAQCAWSVPAWEDRARNERITH